MRNVMMTIRKAVIRMNKKQIKLIAVAVLLSVLMLLISGCWDSHELDSLFIVTGIALDKADDPEKLDITLQVGKTQSNASGSDDANSQSDNAIVLRTTASTMIEALIEFNRNSSRTLLLQHNQVVLFGSALAEQGLKQHIDLFIRDQKTRMEVLFMVADGRADEILSVKLDPEKTSGIYLSHVMQDLYNVSPYYKVRMLDFVSRLLDGTFSPVAPIASLVGEDDKQHLEISGLAVFKHDKMVGRLNNDEASGYIWTMGKVGQGGVVCEDDSGRAVFNIDNMDCARDVTLRSDGGIHVALEVNAALSIDELSGLSELQLIDMVPVLTEMARNQILEQIADTLRTAQRLNADIYGFGVSLHRKYPKEWQDIKDRWDELFTEIEFDIKVKVVLKSTGEITKSLEME